MKSTLKQFMGGERQSRIGEKPMLHQTCIELFKVARPGKTARDKANGHVPYRRNRREYDKRTGITSKL